MHYIQYKTLGEQQLCEVQNWLKQHNFNIQRLRREFSDVLPLAEILKISYPRLIDLNNYPKKNSVQLKLNHWETFNHKVLSKFNLSLSRQLMDLLAAGEHGAAEVLIYEIIRLEKRQLLEQQRSEASRQDQIWEENEEIKTVIINKKVGDGIVQMPQKMILYSMYENVVRECQEKDALIEDYKQRLTHMENLITINRERINELLLQTNKLPTKSVSEPCSTCSSQELSLNFRACGPPAASEIEANNIN